jgi:eukaryotic-like serine/threonine-protein kinase
MEPMKCGEYTLHERLNEGGTAEIFLATSPDNKQVVVRRLRSKFQFDISKRRKFSRGLAIQTKMKSPTMVQVFKTVHFATLPYAVMEYVDGINLRLALLQKDPLLDNPHSIFAKMLEGLSFIHQNGYLHLDIKPENIHLSRNGLLKILDFDLAEKIHHPPKAQHGINGTPSYLAPEQILKHPVDERTDIFALGITAFELFTHHKPHVTNSRQETFHSHSNLEKPFPSPRSLEPELSHKLDRIISRCIEKKVERRYPNIAMILRDFHEDS